MIVVGPGTVCVAFLSYDSLLGDSCHDRWDNGCAGEWKMQNEYGTNGLQGSEASLAKIARGGLVEGAIAGTKGQS